MYYLNFDRRLTLRPDDVTRVSFGDAGVMGPSERLLPPALLADAACESDGLECGRALAPVARTEAADGSAERQPNV